MTATLHATRAVSAKSLDRRLNIVMADDDRNDQLLMVMAAEESGLPIEFTFVDDGSELLLFLSRIENVDQLPDAIVLDLRMPRLDGHKTLDRLQAHSVFWQIPVVVFTTSRRYRDLCVSRDLGAREFETKPSDFAGLVSFVDRLGTMAAERLPITDWEGSLGSADEERALLDPDMCGIPTSDDGGDFLIGR
jgi:CheY-like chemotaxis protein